jgi:hypothetical protein
MRNPSFGSRPAVIRRVPFHWVAVAVPFTITGRAVTSTRFTSVVKQDRHTATSMGRLDDSRDERESTAQ